VRLLRLCTIFIRYVDSAADLIPHCSNLKLSQVDVFQALLMYNSDFQFLSSLCFSGPQNLAVLIRKSLEWYRNVAFDLAKKERQLRNLSPSDLKHVVQVCGGIVREGGAETSTLAAICDAPSSETLQLARTASSGSVVSVPSSVSPGESTSPGTASRSVVSLGSSASPGTVSLKSSRSNEDITLLLQDFEAGDVLVSQEDFKSQVVHQDAIVSRVEENPARELGLAFKDLDSFTLVSHVDSSQIVARRANLPLPPPKKDTKIPVPSKVDVGAAAKLRDRLAIIAAAQSPVSAAAGVLQRTVTNAHKRTRKDKENPNAKPTKPTKPTKEKKRRTSSRTKHERRKRPQPTKSKKGNAMLAT